MTSPETDSKPGWIAGYRVGWVICVVLAGLLLVHAAHYSFLCDDAYISFRYVQNALHGHGLVFNPRERVEGYSNFLWILQLIGFGWVGIGPEISATVLSILYTLASLVVSLALLRELIHKKHFFWSAPLLLLFLAANRSIAIWTTSGLETRSDTFFILLGVYGTLRYLRKLPLAWLGIVGWSAACLTRPDSIMLLVVAAGMLILFRRGVAASLRFAAIPIAVEALHFLWRRIYYGDWLPNTYYAKVTAPWWDAGAYYLSQAIVEYGLWLVVPLGIATLWLTKKRRVRCGVGLLLILTAAQAFYLARLGGDHFEYRPLDFCWPAWYLAMVAGLAALLDRMRISVWKRMAIATGISLCAFVYGFALPTASTGAAERELVALRPALVTPVQIESGDLGAARLLPGIGPLRRLWNALSRKTTSFFVLRYRAHRLFAEEQLRCFKAFPQYEAEGIIPKDTVALLSGGGIFSYYTGLETIERYGLTDKTIAHNRSSVLPQRKLAHIRVVPPDYLKRRGVNMIEPIVWDSLPQQFVGRKGIYVVRLPDGRFLTFQSETPGWVHSRFKGRLVETTPKQERK